MRDTPPSRTLLMYFVPPTRITSPSFPAWTACSVSTSSPAGEKGRTAVSSILTMTMLPSLSISTPFGAERGEPSSKVDAVPSGETRKTRLWTGVGRIDRAIVRDGDAVPHAGARRYVRAERFAHLDAEHADVVEVGGVVDAVTDRAADCPI